MHKTHATESLSPSPELKGFIRTGKTGGPLLELVVNTSTSGHILPSLPLKLREGKHQQSSTASLLVFDWQRFHQIAPELPSLFTAHWKELALNQDCIPLAPDFDKYYRMDIEGSLRILTVRTEGRLVGYAFLIVGSHLHYSSTLWAHAEMFYLDPLYRQGWTGVKLFKEVLRGIKAMDCKMLTVPVKLHFMNARVIKLLERLGLRQIEVIMAKRID